MNSKSLYIISALFCLSAATLVWGEGAKSFSDDFATLSDSPSKLGPDWYAKDGGWKAVKPGEVTWPKVLPGVMDSLLQCKAVTLAPGSTIAADIRLDSDDGAHWGGLAFNIQDERNFYAFRIVYKKPMETGYYQILKFIDGQPKPLKFVEVELNSGILYTLTVQIIENGLFKYSIRQGDKTILEAEEPAQDNVSPYTGGYAGLYSCSVQCFFTGFRITPGATAQ